VAIALGRHWGILDNGESSGDRNVELREKVPLQCIDCIAMEQKCLEVSGVRGGGGTTIEHNRTH
jgi:hypothetical protein